MLASHYSIYILLDPRTNEVRYVGYTKDITKRLYMHVGNCNNNSHKSNWIKQLKTLGLRPKPKTLCVLSSFEEALRVEIATIALYRSRGVRLTNSTDGGEGGVNFPPEVKERISRGIKAAMTPERRAAISAHTAKVRTGTKHSDETKERMSAAWEKRRAKGCNPLKGRKRPQEVCEKIRKSHLGARRSEECKDRISATRKEKFAAGDYNASYKRDASGRFEPKHSKGE